MAIKVRTEVNHLNPTDLDRIHIKRMAHANFCVFAELMKLGNPSVDAILNDWSITLMPGARVGIEYSFLHRQACEAELKAHHAKKVTKKAKKKGK